ncbi:STAS domain-containing protein [Nonomuraea ferruginea]|uniref:STAS domain-containing protein n=2 Tax=Nonomuraea TaxID=83681 RepID=A0ABT4T2V4_9ACTN|nr:STAS domain-containing protein [Nonomuraea ferruginea]MDA0643665.1 STAS domain-containing protein [Nonomuraea ferruginea]
MALAGETMVMSGAGHAHVPAAEHLLYVDSLLRVTCTVMPGPSLVRLEGDIDVTNRAEAVSALQRARRIDADLIVDVGRVGFIDLAGLRSLLGLAACDGVVVRNTPRQMRRLIDVLGLPPLD